MQTRHAPRLAERFEDEDPEVRLAALDIFRYLEEALLAAHAVAIGRCLRDEDVEVRKMAGPWLPRGCPAPPESAGLALLAVV